MSEDEEVCPECNQPNWWCKPCISTHFKNDFDKWTSGDEAIDKFIQDTQLVANIDELKEWIPYDRFQDIKLIAKGGYGTIYHAKWIDGWISGWDIENQQWKRKKSYMEVVLKKFDGIVNINDEFLNELKVHFELTGYPKTHEYMMVLHYASGGSLRNYLNNNFNNMDWVRKLIFLSNIANQFSQIHERNIVHRDLHPGNILKYYSDEEDTFLRISDFGLGKFIKENTKNPQKDTISGVLPYIAPEVLIGEEYTKAADVYSFAFVAYEIITGLPPYNNVSHDNGLALKICNGFRPKIPIHTPKLITQIIMRCWDARITKRPTFEELHKELNKYLEDYRENKLENNNEITIQIKEAEEFSKNQTTDLKTTTTPMNYQTHPKAVYTSRLLKFSSLPEPQNEENFEKKLEEMTESFYKINDSDDDFF
ncbi:hypothetical protein Glove_220g48 [Diversispora epigaea]|uniref:Protein kinase domain-containing protein n=1 Tax=Diversispora epigaea TaxID=1348612 RepID=A0A397ILH1_9GLOM|nr:hypothetical protein Glove_220g48 [Diversispora epigaea]